MFWLLILAHFVADYPLQPGWLVQAKRRLPGLTFHVAIHLLLMFVVSIGRWRVAWPYLLILALIHFGLDFGKNQLALYKPTWIILPYLLDQVLHILSIGLIASWIDQRPGLALEAPLHSPAIIYSIGYLLATYVWFITERILVHANPAYRQEVNVQFWPRMVTRSALLTCLLLISNGWLAALIASSLFPWPYLSGHYRRRALLTDIGVVLVTWVFILWVR